MLSVIKSSIILFLLTIFFLPSLASVPIATRSAQQLMTPEKAVSQLMQGNERFVQNHPSFKNFKQIRQINTQGQHPFAFIFNCIDSRSVPNYVFDQPMGNIFVGRIAGNVVDLDVLGSMEYAVKFAGSPLIVVMGHTNCGAVHGACEKTVSGNIASLLHRIQPAVNRVTEHLKKHHCNDPALINQIAKQNVLYQTQYILKNSETIRALVNKHKILLIGAMHDIKTGKVTFFDLEGKELKYN